MKYIYVLLSIFIILSCENNAKDVNTDFSIRQIYFQRLQATDIVMYQHYVLIENYSGQFSIQDILQKYYDTCYTKLPIKSIVFLKENDDLGFDDNELKFDKINKSSLVSFYLNPDTNHLSILGIGIYHEDRRFIIDLK